MVLLLALPVVFAVKHSATREYPALSQPRTPELSFCAEWLVFHKLGVKS